MIRTTFLLLSLVVLGGASLPPGPCGGTPAFGVPLPSHLDMAGSAGGTVSPSVAMVMPNLVAPGGMGCDQSMMRPVPSGGGATSALSNESADILHGLPTTERLRSPYESQRITGP